VEALFERSVKRRKQKLRITKVTNYKSYKLQKLQITKVTNYKSYELQKLQITKVTHYIVVVSEFLEPILQLQFMATTLCNIVYLVLTITILVCIFLKSR
jgi:hypothetical protein